MLNQIKQDAELRMKKSLELLNHEFSKLRTGRAHPSLLEGLTVEYYGQKTPLNQLAGISVDDPRTLLVTPYDKAMVEAVDKAIRTSDFGLNPATAGQVIRVPLPPLTEENRRALTKQMKAEAENARVAVRNIRRDANNKLKQLLKDKELGEDEERKGQDQIQKLTDNYIAQIEQCAEAKEADLMKV